MTKQRVLGVRRNPESETRERSGTGSLRTPGRIADADRSPEVRRTEVEADARSRGGDHADPTPVILRLGPAEISALRHAVEMYLFLDMVGEGRSILEELYALLASSTDGDSGERAAVP